MNLAPLEIDNTHSYAPLVDITPSRLFFMDPFAQKDLQYPSDMLGPLQRDEFQPEDIYLPAPEAYFYPEFKLAPEVVLPGDIDSLDFLHDPTFNPSLAGPLSEDEDRLHSPSPEEQEQAKFDQEMDALDVPPPTAFMKQWLTNPKLRAQPYWSRPSATKCGQSGCKLSLQTNLEMQMHIHIHSDGEGSTARHLRFCTIEGCLHNLVGFRTQCNLDRHMRTAHTQRRFNKCEWCLKSFNRKDSVVRHQLLKHCKKQQPKKTMRKGLRSSSA